MVQGERMQRKRNRESREPRSFFRHGIPLMHQTTKRQGTIQNRFSGRINSAKAAIVTDANRKTRRCVLMNFRKKNLQRMVPKVAFPTGTVQVTLDEGGISTYNIRENVAWDNIPFTPELEDIARRCRAVCWGSLAQRNVVSRETIHKFLETMPDGGGRLKIFDVNLRQNFYNEEVLCDSLRHCNVLKINDEELVIIGRMFGYPGLDMRNKCWLILGKYNLDMLVLTCGTNGSYVFTPGRVSFQETPRVEVVDTVGAGDSFTGAFCAGILKGMSVPDAHKMAVDVSAYVCTQSGAMPVLPGSIVNRI